MIGALRGGAGKSVVSLGLAACLTSRGKRLSVFKKGPDYIDSAWLSRAASAACFNLDTYLMGEAVVKESFLRRIADCDAALVEGNRGIFDGLDLEGSHSSAALAKLLGLSVFLVLDCTKSTRTVAALVKGCQAMDPELRLSGVILNRIGNVRHEAVVRASIERTCAVPVVGALPRLDDLGLPERHLGLLPPQEHGEVEGAIQKSREAIEKYVDVDRLLELAAPPFEDAPSEGRAAGSLRADSNQPFLFSGIRIGVVRDEAFHFYYPENLETLVASGAAITEVDAIRSRSLPPVDALYIGGGFPESRAEALAENRSLMQSVRDAVEDGLPVYAECGGAVYLGKGLKCGGLVHPFVGVFPVVYELHRRPQGHGYTLLEVDGDNPLFPKGIRLKGHEFHYSGVLDWGEEVPQFACRVKKGYGFDGFREGLWVRNVYATFSHLHALGDSRWVELFLGRAAARADSASQA
jgi:cobyrinic acid a,c-diamide synthase